MPGPVPGIHVFLLRHQQYVDGRVKPGKDGWWLRKIDQPDPVGHQCGFFLALDLDGDIGARRSEEHTSELQSRSDLVCRLLLEKKKKNHKLHIKSLNKNIEQINPQINSLK